MKALIAPLAFSLALLSSAGAPALGPACATGNVPAATLLIPYFEVDLDDPEGRTTHFSISNVGTEGTLAHAVVWSSWGLPVLSFDLHLEAGAVRTVNLHRVLADGVLPQSEAPAAGGSSCADLLAPPPLDPDARAELRAGLTGEPSPGDGLCRSAPPPAEGVATGYLTLDVVDDCALDVRYPSDAGYFADGGTGLAANRNQLTGDFFLVDPKENLAQGFEAVAVVADADAFGPGELRSRHSFYRWQVGFSGVDNRASLGHRHRARFLNGGAFEGGSELLIWTESYGLEATAAECGADGFSNNVTLASLRARNEAAGLLSEGTVTLGAHVLRLAVGSAMLPVDEPFGSLEVTTEYFLATPILPESPVPLQSHVISLLSAGGRFGVGFHAVRLDDPCTGGEP